MSQDRYRRKILTNPKANKMLYDEGPKAALLTRVTYKTHIIAQQPPGILCVPSIEKLNTLALIVTKKEIQC